MIHIGAVERVAVGSTVVGAEQDLFSALIYLAAVTGVNGAS
jgi:hypothetical protein